MSRFITNRHMSNSDLTPSEPATTIPYAELTPAERMREMERDTWTDLSARRMSRYHPDQIFKSNSRLTPGNAPIRFDAWRSGGEQGEAEVAYKRAVHETEMMMRRVMPTPEEVHAAASRHEREILPLVVSREEAEFITAYTHFDCPLVSSTMPTPSYMTTVAYPTYLSLPVERSEMRPLFRYGKKRQFVEVEEVAIPAALVAGAEVEVEVTVAKRQVEIVAGGAEMVPMSSRMAPRHQYDRYRPAKRSRLSRVYPEPEPEALGFGSSSLNSSTSSSSSSTSTHHLATPTGSICLDATQVATHSLAVSESQVSRNAIYGLDFDAMPKITRAAVNALPKMPETWEEHVKNGKRKRE